MAQNVSMDEFEALLNESFEIDTPQEGSVVKGKVIAVGPGAFGDDNERMPLDVKKGDRVLFGKWGGTEVKIDGKDLLIMKESDIMGVIG